MIRRALEPFDRYVRPGQVLVIYGPRRVGKTTLLRSYLAGTALRYKLVSGDDINTQSVLGSQDASLLQAYVEGYDLLAVDEAQNVPHIGLGLKILVDALPQLHVIAIGSSSFERAGQLGEPLTGRKRTLDLYPIAQSELLATANRYELRQRLPELLVFGSYPEVIQAPSRAQRIDTLMEIAGSYLLKDVLALDRIRNSRTLSDLLRLLAFQVGSEVSLNELATKLSIDVKTVQRYLDLLTKAFVITRLGGFSGNLRQEVTSKAKYYFLDTGIRNAIIAQFNDLGQRQDVGQLWENFVLVERMKKRAYTHIYANTYFWRTYSQQEIDLVEEREGRLFGYECKWASQAQTPAPRQWREAYPQAEFSVITPDNYLDFVA